LDALAETLLYALKEVKVELSNVLLVAKGDGLPEIIYKGEEDVTRL
jgi:hypothetical protein